MVGVGDTFLWDRRQGWLVGLSLFFSALCYCCHHRPQLHCHRGMDDCSCSSCLPFIENAEE